LRKSDLHGAVRLAVAAVRGTVDLVEEWHMNLIGRRLARSAAGRISAATYAGVRRSAELAGGWAESLLGQRDSAAAGPASSSERDAVLAALNGFIGDRLAASGNPLAIPMRLRQQGRALDLDRASLARDLPQATGKIVVLVHGLCRSDLQWRRNEHDHGEALAQGHGYTPVYLHYNTGRHLSQNGREFARLMEELAAAWPVKVEQIAIIGHSMGGLVARSACHYAMQEGHRWQRHLRHLVFLGTPHHGAPLERGGQWLTELIGRTVLTAPFARLARLRSAGITDLRYGNLLDEDWRDRDRFEEAGDNRTPVPLPDSVHCYVIAGTTGRRMGDIRDRLLGDGVIPLDTALGRHSDAGHSLIFPDEHQWIGFGIHHLDLLSRQEVFERIVAWLVAARLDEPRGHPQRRFRRRRATLHDAAERKAAKASGEKHS
jgi:pimeloyl-ACP methyl ester carboxylesterase